MPLKPWLQSRYRAHSPPKFPPALKTGFWGAPVCSAQRIDKFDHIKLSNFWIAQNTINEVKGSRLKKIIFNTNDKISFTH